MRRPALSVVIPTFNRGEALRLTLRSVLAQRIDVPYEIVVVDNNSSDSTREIVRSCSGVRYFLETRPGAAHVRNSGIERSHGEIIVFIDDDAVAEPNWLQELHRVYREIPDAWCVGGKILPAFQEPVPVWFDQSVRALSGSIAVMDLGNETLRLSYPADVWGPNFSITRVALDRVGGFRTDLGPVGTCRRAGEETELCWRVQGAGGGVYYCGQAIVSHFIPPSHMTRAYFRRRAYWYGRTGRLLGLKRAPLKPVLVLVAWEQARAALGRPLSPVSTFTDTLEVLWQVGHIHQSLLDALPNLPWTWPGRDSMLSRRNVS
jgi:glucosyl-dolichyl phosphate glucuronosyltransferase